MIRFLSIAIVLMVLTFTSQGQTFHLNENFNSASGNTPPTGWTNVLIQGNASYDFWRFNNPIGRPLSAPLAGNHAIFDSDGFSVNGGFENVSLESPSVNTTGYLGVTLQFDYYYEGYFNSDAIVEIWNGTSWINVWSSGTNTSGPTTITVNVTAQAANRASTRVRFRYTGDYGYYWQVDNVKMFTLTDVSASALTNFGGSCGSSADKFYLSIKNNGSTPVSNVNVGLIVNAGVPQTKILTRTIQPNATDTISFDNTYNSGSGSGGTYNLKGYVNIASDAVVANDTNLKTIVTSGIPTDPILTNMIQCGTGSASLSGIKGPGDSLLWFNSAGTLLGSGNPFNSPTITSTTTFFAQSVKGNAPPPGSSFQTGANGFNFVAGDLTNWNGWMLNCTPNKTMKVDSFAVRFWLTGTQTIRIYVRTGSYNAAITNPATWTLLGEKTLNVTTTTAFTNINIGGTSFTAAQTYGIYICVLNGEVMATGSTVPVSNADMTVQGGNWVWGLFASQGNGPGYTQDMKIFYGSCASNKVPLTVSVFPKPAGATMVKGTTYQGKYRAGTISQQDLALPTQVLNYDIIAPTGQSNATYGSGWTATVSLTTQGNTPVNAATYSLITPGAANGRVNFTPYAALVDSSIRVSVKITSVANGCDTTFIRWLYIAPKPVANFTASNVCEGKQVVFNNTGTLLRGFLTYTWDFGDGSSTGARNPKHTYAAAGTYNVKLVLTSDLGYADSITKPVTVHETGVANFTARNACASDAVLFTNTSTVPSGTTNSWNFGDGNNSSGQSPSHQYSSPNSYTATLTTTTSNGCISTKTKTVYQFPDPVASFTSVAGCQDDMVTFTNASTLSTGVIGYTWMFGDGTGSDQKDAGHLYLTPGTYNVSMIATSYFGCDDTLTQQVTVQATPKASFTANNVCKGGSIDFNNGSTIASGNTFTTAWDFNDGNTSNSLSPAHTYSSTGTYAVKLTVSNGSCSDEIVKSVEVFEKPVAGFNGMNVCQGEETRLVNTSNLASGSVNYLWTLGDGNTSTSSNVNHKYSTTGQKTVWLKVSTDAGCMDSISKTVEVFANPNSDFDINHSASRSYSFAPKASGLASYSWTFGEATRSSTASPSHTYLFDGLFNICLQTTNSNGCETETCKELRVNTTSMESLESGAAHITVYPNPSNGVFTVKSSTDTYTATVYDIYGKVVREINANEVSNGTVEINLSGEAAGVYMVKINENGNVAIKKITIQ